MTSSNEMIHEFTINPYLSEIDSLEYNRQWASPVVVAMAFEQYRIVQMTAWKVPCSEMKHQRQLYKSVLVAAFPAS